MVNEVDRGPFIEAVKKLHNGPAVTWDQATYDRLQAIEKAFDFLTNVTGYRPGHVDLVAQSVPCPTVVGLLLEKTHR